MMQINIGNVMSAYISQSMYTVDFLTLVVVFTTPMATIVMTSPQYERQAEIYREKDKKLRVVKLV